MAHRRNVARTGRARHGERARRPAAPAIVRRRIPVYELLDEEQLVRLETHADWILKEIGVEFRDADEAVALFRSAGASVGGNRVRFDAGLARDLCSTAPAEYRMHGRDAARDVMIGGDHIVLGPAYGPPFVTDLQKGRRYASLADFENFVKLTYATPWLHHSGGTVCEPVDIPVNKRHLDMVYAHIRHSTKPFMGSVTAPERARDSIDMARIVFGEAFVDGHCVVQGNINVNSPLVFDDVMVGALTEYARANQGIVLSPFILGGAMGPVTQPALLAQAHAEAMVGIALGQLVRPGSPAVYGNFLTTMDLRSGAPTFGTPEANLSTFAIGQLCRRLGLPLRCGGHYTASKVADGQAMQESVGTMLAGLMAGANFIHQSAGWLEGGLTIGYEKFVMDADHCGMALRLMGGLEIDEDTLAAEAFREAGPGGNYLGTSHTLAHFRTANHEADLADVASFEQWQEAGALDLQARANRRWRRLLEETQPPPIDPSVDEALKDFIRRRKAAAPDQWH